MQGASRMPMRPMMRSPMPLGRPLGQQTSMFKQGGTRGVQNRMGGAPAMGAPQTNPYQLVNPVQRAGTASEALAQVKGRTAGPVGAPTAPQIPNAWSRLNFNPKTTPGGAPNLSAQLGPGGTPTGPAGVIAQGTASSNRYGPMGGQGLLQNSSNPLYDLSQMGPNMYAQLMNQFYGFGSFYGG